MKIVFYFGLIVMALFISVMVGVFLIKKTRSLWAAFFMSYLLCFIILGSGSIWWFMTETDGISQGIGVLIYGIALAGIGIINLLFCFHYYRRLQA
jgi:hypothetical protein